MEMGIYGAANLLKRKGGGSMKGRSTEEISRIGLAAAGLIEQALQQLKYVQGLEPPLQGLRRFADHFAAEAVAAKVDLAHDIEQNYGRHS